MAGPSSSDDGHDDGGRGAGLLVWGLVILLALGATAVLVISADARLLRLAVVAALWAALIGAFVAARYRRAVSQRDDSAEELRTVYELELEREVAARREYELEVESQTRQRLAEEARADVRDDLAALRQEITSLKENLETLFGGELLVERVALRAESTRMRTLGEPPHRMLAAAREGRQRGIVAGSLGSAMSGRSAAITGSASTEDPQTELIRAVANDFPEPPRRDPLRSTGRNEPVRPERNRREPTDQRPHSPAANGDRQPLGARRDAGQASRRDLPRVAAGSARPGQRPSQQRPAEDWQATTYTQWDGQSEQPSARNLQPVDPPSHRDFEPVDQSPHHQPVVETGSYRNLRTVDTPSYRDLNAVDPSSYRNLNPVDSSSRGDLNPVGPGSRRGFDAVDPSAHRDERPHDGGSHRNLQAVAEPADAGAHASGRSVSDLLAAHGNADTPRRRRRRAED